MLLQYHVNYSTYLRIVGYSVFWPNMLPLRFICWGRMVGGGEIFIFIFDV